MRRSLVALVVGAVLVMATGTAAAKQNVRIDREMDRECRFQWVDKAAWSSREERLTSICAIGRWDVSGGYPKFYAVGACESGWGRFASNGGRYLGLFQHAASSWFGRVNHFEPRGWDLAPSWTNSRSQIVVTARMVHVGGWGPWSCA
jgi:hypothetical protein